VFNKTTGDYYMHSNILLNAFSIQQFCNTHSISRAKFYLLLKEGLAPKLMCVGRRRLISVEAAAEWRKKMEAEGGKNEL
jgi:hypothetical protein